MPPIKHALLGASSAARWIACPPSARATENLPDEETKYAAEATRAWAVRGPPEEQPPAVGSRLRGTPAVRVNPAGRRAGRPA